MSCPSCFRGESYLNRAEIVFVVAYLSTDCILDTVVGKCLFPVEILRQQVVCAGEHMPNVFNFGF